MGKEGYRPQPSAAEQQNPQVRRTFHDKMLALVDTTKGVGRRVVVVGLVPLVAAGALAACRKFPEQPSGAPTPPSTHQTVEPHSSPTKKIWPPEPGVDIRNEVPLSPTATSHK